MKILGTTGSEAFICEVSKSELEQFYNCYYHKKHEELGYISDFKVGQNIDLGKGYNHLSEIQNALSEIKSFVKANEKIIQAISGGLNLLTKNEAL